MTLNHIQTVRRKAQGTRTPLPRAWMVLILLTAVYMINFMDKAVIGLAAVPIMKDLGITPIQFGAINSLFFTLFVPASLIGGLLADRWPTKWILTGMVVIWSAAMLPMFLPLGFSALVASRMVLGAGEGPTSPVATHSLYKWFTGTQRFIPQAIFCTGPVLAIVAGAPLLTWIVVVGGWHRAFGLLGLASLVWVVIWSVVGIEGPENANAGTASEIPLKPTKSRQVALSARIAPYCRIIFSRTYIGCVCLGFASYLVQSVLISWFPAFLNKGLGFTLQKASWIVSGEWLLFGLTPLVVATLVRALLNRNVKSKYACGYVPAAFLLLGSLCLFGSSQVAPGPWQVAILLVAFAAPAGISPLLFTVLGSITDTSHRGGVLGSFGALIVSAGLLGPIMLGYAIQSGITAQSGYYDGFRFLAWTTLIGGLLGLLLVNPERHQAALDGLAPQSNAGPFNLSGER